MPTLAAGQYVASPKQIHPTLLLQARPVTG
jgi:hypothetical protein